MSATDDILPPKTKDMLAKLGRAWAAAQRESAEGRHDPRHYLQSAILVAISTRDSRLNEHLRTHQLMSSDPVPNAYLAIGAHIWAAVGHGSAFDASNALVYFLKPAQADAYHKLIEDFTEELLAGDLGKLIEHA